jgi:DNA-binding GntR family transcriptional regulator
VSVDPAVVQSTLQDELVTLLRNLIIEGELRPGSRITETRLCARFGVSRTPLRKALKVLSAEGLVRFLPNKGASVVRVTHTEIEEAVPIFGALEALAGELACARIDKESLGCIWNTHWQMVEHFRRGERRPYAVLNRALHEAIFEAANNKTLSENYNMLQVRYSSLLPGQPGQWPEQMRQMFQSVFQSSTGRAHWAAEVEEHEQMLAALEAGDRAQFAQIARRHIRHRAEVMHMALDMLEVRTSRVICLNIEVSKLEVACGVRSRA